MINYVKRLSEMYPDDNFLPAMSEWEHDFEILSVENGGTYGITYYENKKTRTYMAKHEAEQDIINTSQHEPIHAILGEFQFFDPDPEEFDQEEEHKMIQKISWVVNEKVFDNGYFSLYNNQHIKPKIKEKEYEKLMKKYNKLSDKLEECNENE